MASDGKTEDGSERRGGARSDRQDRLALALRDNLRRRKAQARARKASASAAPGREEATKGEHGPDQD